MSKKTLKRRFAIAACQVGMGAVTAWSGATPIRWICPGTVGQVWSHALDDPETNVEIIAGPEKAFVEPRSRFVYWNPTASDRGPHMFRIRAGSESIEVPVEVVPLRKALFIFAHSDDEFGIIGTIDRWHRAGVEVHGVWTCTSRGGRSQRESAAAWAELGIPAEQMHFHFNASPRRRPDGVLNTRDALADLLRRHEFQKVFVVGYEGGHIEHDLTNAALAEALIAADFRGQAYEFGLYNFHAFPFPSLLRPIPATPPLVEVQLAWAEYRRLQDLTEFYPSQKQVTTGFRWALPQRQKRRQYYRPLPRWDYTRRPYTGRPLWYRLSPRHRDRFGRDFLPLINAYFHAEDRARPTGRFEQDF